MLFPDIPVSNASKGRLQDVIKKWHLIFFPQFCQQVSAEGRGLLRSAGTVPEGYWDLRAGMHTFHLCQLWWLDVCFSSSHLVGSKYHTSVLNTYYFDGLSVFTEKLMEMRCTICTLQKFSLQQWRICTFNDWHIRDVAEALSQAFKMVAEIITTLTDCECFCTVQIYIFLHEALLCITIW